MPISWSDPTQQTAGVLSSKGPDALHFADIGPIVAQIMRMKENQAAQKRQDQAQMIQGVGDLATGAYKGYENYQTGQGEKAMADYIDSYHAGLTSTDPATKQQAQIDMDAKLSQMTAKQKIDAMKWQIAQDDKHENLFTTDPQTGQRYYKTKGGISPVSGAGSNKVYSDELGYEVSPQAAEAAKKGKVTLEESQASDAEKEVERLYPKKSYGDLKQTLAPGKGKGYVYGDKGVLRAAEEGETPDVIAPYAAKLEDVQAGKIGFRPGEVSYIQQKKAEADQHRATAETLKKKIYQPRGAFGGGTTGLTADVQAIQAEYKANPTPENEAIAKQKLAALGIH